VLRFSEALRIAELQAAKLRQLTDVSDTAMPEEALAQLPRIEIRRAALPTSGMSYWDGNAWVIAINDSEPEGRQRFTIFHEYKHILDHGRTDRLYRGSRNTDPAAQAEQVADYFAGCVLMPKRLMKRAWGEGIQTPAQVAQLFDVSTRAAEVRLAQLGLPEPKSRCDYRPPRSTSTVSQRRYYRTTASTTGMGVAS
jgi:Zn-dependent peptidase ImmA (M78 family)